MKILVTGASGFIGANLCHRLVGCGEQFIACDNLSFGKIENTEGKYPLLKCSFGDIPQNTLDQFDVLIHLATSNIIYAMDKPIQTFKNNALLTCELFEKFKGKIVYTSTASVYGNASSFPTTEQAEIKLSNAYDTSKYMAELFLRQRGNFTTLRLGNVYGRFQDQSSPYCGVLGKFVDKYLSGSPLTIYGDGTATRDYTYVEDVVDAILIAMHHPSMDTEVNIATGLETSVLDLASLISEESEVERLEARTIDSIQRRCLSINRAWNLFAWKPKTDISQGIKQLIKIKSAYAYLEAKTEKYKNG
jgi:UDP-glucose 4-epimerase